MFGINYVNKNLRPNEKLVGRAPVSVIALLPVGILCALYLIGTLILAIVQDSFRAFLLGIVISVAIMGVAYLKMRSIELAVTDMRIIGKTGFFSSFAMEASLDKIDSITVFVPFFGKIFGYGTIIIRAGLCFRAFSMISNVTQFKNLIFDCIEAREKQFSGAGGSAGMFTPDPGRMPAPAPAPFTPPQPEIHTPPMPQSGGDETVAFGQMIGKSGQYAGQQIRLKPNETMILGRDAKRASLLFDNPKVSGAHLSIRFETNSYVIQDMSTYGVFLETGSGMQKMQKGVDVRVNKGTVIAFADSEKFLLK